VDNQQADGRIPKNFQSQKTDWAKLDENVPVTLVVDRAQKEDPTDNKFKLFCQVVDGTQKGKMTSLNFMRRFSDGQWVENTIDFLSTLLPQEFNGEQPIWSYMLVGKVFTCIPYKNKRGYWAYNSFELKGMDPTKQPQAMPQAQNQQPPAAYQQPQQQAQGFYQPPPQQAAPQQPAPPPPNDNNIPW
jgi:hypothetical protein